VNTGRDALFEEDRVATRAVLGTLLSISFCSMACGHAGARACVGAWVGANFASRPRQNAALLLFSGDYRSYSTASLGSGTLFLHGIDWGPLHISLIRIIVITTTAALMIGLTLFVSRTRVGKAMRATAYDREAAAMMGIDIDKVIVFAFVLGSALAGAAGVLFALRVPTYATIGFLIGLKGFTAAVIGGIGSIPGALAGGLVLGFAESYTQGYISTRWSDLLVFVILILFLLFRPQGLLGKADIRKV